MPSRPAFLWHQTTHCAPPACFDAGAIGHVTKPIDFDQRGCGIVIHRPAGPPQPDAEA